MKFLKIKSVFVWTKGPQKLWTPILVGPQINFHTVFWLTDQAQSESSLQVIMTPILSKMWPKYPCHQSLTAPSTQAHEKHSEGRCTPISPFDVPDACIYAGFGVHTL